MKNYSRRIIDNTLDELIPYLPAIALEGARGVGKTATANKRSETTIDLSVPSNRVALKDNPALVLQVPHPVFIDEWQLEPNVWNTVRRAVDDGATGGKFLLAGSALIGPDAQIHSGAGRIISLQMRPMSLYERNVCETKISLQKLMNGETQNIDSVSNFELSDYVDEILKSGFPAIRDLPDHPRQIQLDGYINRLIERELLENGIRVRRPLQLKSWLTAYAAATSSSATYTKILDSAMPGEGNKPARQTVSIYTDTLRRMFIIDPLEAWIPQFSPLKRLTYSQKHHLVDPALSARLVGVNKIDLLSGKGVAIDPSVGTWLGALFESLATQSIRIYAQSFGASLGHFRTKDSIHEIDLIVEGQNRKILAIEIKVSQSVEDSDTKHLHWLSAQIGPRLIEKVIINTGKYAYRRNDGVVVIPLSLLGP